ncbi:hypothetical protein RHMOL_Rhmol03G0290000 [Rhododendron molle]|uniref:Uncharacterized protein n=1 Tax=Rhododendron molle TaxID=49168 RepID=A0ACC0PJ98_RHOML|nr:hypothetical protein RHMOL_Rhmol03G0290000 [Rhododendron molle]
MDSRKGKGSPKVATPSISSRKTTLVVSAASQDLKVGRKRPAPQAQRRDHWVTSALQESSGRTRRAATTSATPRRRRHASSGEPHVERGTGKVVGTKKEFRTSSSVKVGNKNSGYSEHTVEERFRDVEYLGIERPANCRVLL